MDGTSDAVMDVEVNGGAGADEGGGADESGGESQGAERQQLTPEQQQAKADREYKTWLKSLRDTDPKVHGKFAKQAQDDRGRLLELSRLEPKGVAGVREKFAILDSVSFEDPERGVLTGPEAVAALQDHARETAEMDRMLAAGDPRALDALGADFNEGLAKLTPSILDRVRAADPEAYAAAVLPHFAQALAQSDLVGNYNAMVDLLNEGMPQWLPEDKKQAWIADKFQRMTTLAGSMGKWLDAQLKAANGKGGTVSRGTQDGKAPPGNWEQTREQQEREKLDTQRTSQHYAANITPKLNQHADQRFSELFRPYAKRLRLDGTARTDLAQAFTSGVVAKAMAKVNGRPGAYEQQMARYWQQRTPPPESVLNYARVEFDKHAKAVMDGLINARYKPFLAGPRNGLNGIQNGSGQRVAANSGQNGAKRAPVSPGVTVVGVKPASSDIDFKNTPVAWIHERKYRLTNGKVVQVRQ